MRITIIDQPNDVVVWASLEGVDGDPRRQSESFAIGGGETRAEAIDEARKELTAAIAVLDAEARS